MASTDTMVGAEGANVCVCVITDKSTLISQCDTHGQRTCVTPQRGTGMTSMRGMGGIL